MQILDRRCSRFSHNLVLLPILGALISLSNAFTENLVICQDSFCSKYDWLKNENTIECIVWEDKKGVHFLGIDQIETGKIAHDGFSSYLSAYSYQICSDSTKKESWRIRDFSPNAATRISYLQNTLSVTDIDSDGTAETCFLYCISGDCCDPWTVKLMLHKDGQKLAIRGQVPIHKEDLESYQINIDPNFSKYDSRLKAFALKQWDKGIYMHWKNALGDSVVTQMILAQKDTAIKIRKNQEPPPKQK